MSRSKPGQNYIDLIEHVLGGVQVTTERDTRSRAASFDLASRPWLGGIARSSVEVSVGDEELRDTE
jgi:hypothetical protein